MSVQAANVGPVGYMMMPLKRYADFKGRSRRSEFWWFILGWTITYLVLFWIGSMLPGTTTTTGGGSVNVSGPGLFLPVIWLVATIVPLIALDVRRLHDTGRSGWWWFIQLVPFIGAIVLLVFFLQDSQPGTNQWGPSPKGT